MEKSEYIAVTNSYLEREQKIVEQAKREAFLKDILVVIDDMDFQIYELYRSLVDAFRRQLDIALSFSREGSWERELIQKAIEMKILPEEKYSIYLKDKEDKKKLEVAGEPAFTVDVAFVSPRSATLCLKVPGKYNTKETYELYVNGEYHQTVDTVVCSVFDLTPDQDYEICVKSCDTQAYGVVKLHTKEESVTINVRDFGAKGDGCTEDTRFIQAAILSCPKNGHVLVPAGVYRITSLFLKSDISIELARGAELLAIVDREKYPVFPALLEHTTDLQEYNLGTWEGNPLPMFAGILTGVQVENVTIYGPGTVNGNASHEDWWKEPKVMKGAYRPRLFFINHCRQVVLQGITLKNSPSWTIHPYFSDDLGFYNVTVHNPSNSPNTDGLDPESCKNVEIAGVKFSLGDDCIAVKSGKIYMGRKCKRPSENLNIHNCLMENGHGAVTIGSEMAGGVKNLLVEDCVFSHTDRGLRIKTRRGRGKDAILDEIRFSRIDMDHVMTPFVVNSFYFCDPDGKTEYVQSREKMEVDDRTPWINHLEFEDILAKNCHVAAAYMEGLPEKKIGKITMRNVKVSYTDHPTCDVPAMSEGVEACTLSGIFAKNVETMILDHVEIEGQNGEAIILEDVDEICRN